MIVSHIRLKNWRNFREVDVPLTSRLFLTGPNACGKSNFLDAFRFLRDIAKTGGGLQQAIQDRNGYNNIQFLGAPVHEGIEIEVDLFDEAGNIPIWKYAIRVMHGDPKRKPFLAHEKVWKDNILILNRDMSKSEKDPESWSQSHLEQMEVNRKFREIAVFFNKISYLHLVPQFLRHPEAFSGPNVPNDPYGKELLDRIESTDEKERKKNLLRIKQALTKAVPQFKNLEYKKDKSGRPHLEAIFRYLHPQKHRQFEDQFSDGTLRLIGLLWSLFEGDGPLLLEEPELSLNSAIVRSLASIIYRLQDRKGKERQVIISTHSSEMLSDPGIGGEEVLLMTPTTEGTRVELTSSIQDIRDLLESGLSVGEVVVPQTEPQEYRQNPLFLDSNE